MNTRRSRAVLFLVVLFSLTTLTTDKDVTIQAQEDTPVQSTSSAKNIELMSSTSLDDGPMAIRVVKNYAYVGTMSGLYIFDVTTPTIPTKIGYLGFSIISTVVQDIQVIGNMAYIASYYGFYILDITNPMSPTEISRYSLGYAQGVDISGTYAYLYTYVPGKYQLIVLDISNPITPTQVGSLDYPDDQRQNDINDIVIAGNYAYLADGPAGLRIVDISNPLSPQEVGFYDTPGDAAKVDIQGSYAYVSDSGKISILDITDPTMPTLVNQFNHIGTSIRAAGNYAYLLGSDVEVYSLVNIHNPRQTGYYDESGEGSVPTALDVVGDYIYMAYSWPYRFVILHFTGEPKRPVILLPGMLTSFNKDCFLSENNCDDRSKWGWSFGDFVGQLYQPMIDELAQAGYTKENGYFRTFYYDWRKPIGFNAAVLQSVITNVLTTTGAAKVDLIGHSMGGLVARAYIQGAGYKNDVANLITIGTPHQGSAMTYSPWEGATFYHIDSLEKATYSFLLSYYAGKDRNLNMIQVIQKHVPSLKDTLVTTDYLFDSANQNQILPETAMKQRNTALHALNSNLSTLFARVNVATIYGQNLETPYRFYVRDRYPLELWGWNDGVPVWERENDFVTPPLGDDTVITLSAQLPNPAYRISVSGVQHKALLRSNDVISASLTALGIPLPTGLTKPAAAMTQTNDTLLVLTLNGTADMTVTDQLGDVVGPAGTTITDAEYISVPNFKIVVIPAQTEGAFTVTVQGGTAGEYELGLLNPGPPPTVITDILGLWDTSHSMVEANIPVNYVISYTQITSNATSLTAEVPIVNMPVIITATMIVGKGMPGGVVEIRDAESNLTLGSGPVDTKGNFLIVLSQRLHLNQQLYAWSNDRQGAAVPIEPIPLYLPIIQR